MRSGLIASLSIAVAAVAGLVIGDDALPVALADKANGAITSDATRPTPAGNPVRASLSSAERSRGLRKGQIGRATCRESGGPEVYAQGGAEYLKKKERRTGPSVRTQID